MSSSSDAALISRLQDTATRRKAFEELVGRYSQPLYTQIRRMVLSHDDADDLLQNTFMKAWTGLDSFRGEARLSTWLYRIAINECFTFLGKNRTQTSLDDPESSVNTDTLESDRYFDADDTARLFQAALATLPQKQRLVFNLKYFEEMKYEEMSQLLNTSVGALKASYHIAVKKIEAFFSQHD